jgi:hypothetical protein
MCARHSCIGHRRIAALLLMEMARVWLCAAPQDGSTALLVACANGSLDVARWLVKDAGCDARSERDKVRYSAARHCVVAARMLLSIISRSRCGVDSRVFMPSVARCPAGRTNGS